MQPTRIMELLTARSQPSAEPTCLTKDFYLEVIEKTIDGYGRLYFEQVLRGTRPYFLCIGLRAAGAMSYFLARGRKPEYLDLWHDLMDLNCERLQVMFDNAESDLAVKEIMIAMKNMKDRADPVRYARWKQALGAIDPNRTYKCIRSEKNKDSLLCNMTVYNMAGEYLRHTEGLTDIHDYFEEYMPWVLSRFDENGMFVDHDHAMLYDLTTRCQLSVMLWYGYDGAYRASLEDHLQKAGIMTLLMQSSVYQLPFGGRSNRYLFNEALVAACCEYEANRYKAAGDERTAGMFKRCARKSAVSISRWFFDHEPPKHIKNFFERDDAFGIDGYGTYHRYLITLANFIGYAYLFADDTITEYDCPSELGGYMLATSDSFSKIFANSCEHFIEIETAADPQYDANGLGRYHKKDVPVELGLSLGFTDTPKYQLPFHTPESAMSLCTGYENHKGQITFLSDTTGRLDKKVTCLSQKPGFVHFRVEYDLMENDDDIIITEEYAIDREGVHITANINESLKKRIWFSVPILHDNGKDHPDTFVTNHGSGAKERSVLTARLPKATYTVKTDGHVIETNTLLANREGVYKKWLLQKNAHTIHIDLLLEAK